MVQLVKRASDVRISEINLSRVIMGSAGTVAVCPIISDKGRTVPVLFTNNQDWLAEYGNPNPAKSMTIQSGLNYFINGNQLWGLRVAPWDATYGGLLLENGEGGYELTPVTFTDPATVNVDALSNNNPIALFYPAQGPGSYSKDISISIGTPYAPPPLVNGIWRSEVSLPANSNTWMAPSASYQYGVSAVTLKGEFRMGQVTVTLQQGSYGNVGIWWDPVPNAVAYRVYKNTASNGNFPDFGLVTVVGATTTDYIDGADAAPDMTAPPIDQNNTPNVEDMLTVYVWDNTQPEANFVESWDCTFSPNVDSSGVQTELENRINPFSQRIQVINNNVTNTSTPYQPKGVSETVMGTGNSSSEVTSFDVVDALQVFQNSQLYKTNVYINAGIADPVMQQGLDTLVKGRGDSVALLDMPAVSQNMQAAIDYRNMTLNLNSTYSAIFNPDLMIVDLINGQRLYVPPSGHVASLCALTDKIANPATSIAGLNRGVVNVLRQRYTFDDGQATQLFNAQVNYFRTFVGQGIALWEQQTLAGDFSALSWLSVRRILCTLKVALYQFLLYSLEEMNTDAVRRQIVNSGSSYLDTLVNSSAIYAYDFVCDASNNPPAAANAGILVISLIIVPSIPIHEIQLDIGISKQGVSFTEVLRAMNGAA
jgi:hypothetical protein